jgi:hypothetical protein
MTQPFPDDTARLQALYCRNNLDIAFIDESYQLSNDLTKAAFYILVAVIAQKSRVETIRERLNHVVGGSKWHTSSDIRKVNGLQTANSIRKLTADNCKVLVASASKFDSNDKNGELTRANLLQELLIRIAGQSPKVGLVILEKRPSGYLASRDKKTISGLRTQKKVPDYLRIVAASPADEHLLWLPDVEAWFERKFK